MLSIFNKDLWRKDLLVWYLYDFANSLISINIIVYFAQWIIIDQGISDFWYSVPVILSTILLIFLSTNVGSKGDREGTHFRIFVISSIITILSVIGIIFVGINFDTAGPIIALVLFGIYQIFFQLSFVPYNAFIKYISKDNLYGKVSGIGSASGNFGSIVGLLMTLPIINGSIMIFGSDRIAPLIPGVLAFLLLSLPIYFVFRHKKFHLPQQRKENTSFWKEFWHNLKESKKYPGVFPFLISFYLFSDAIITITLYSSIYLEKVFLLSDAAKVNIFILILAGIVLGAFVGGILSDKLSNKKILLVFLILNSLTIFSVAFNKETGLLYLIFVLFGITMGGVFASSRGYLAYLIPTSESGKFFGLYTFAERFASIMGPAAFGLTLIIFSSNASGYRVAAFVMALFVLLGSIPLMASRSKH